MKGNARIRPQERSNPLAELDSYEAHGIGKKEIKRKRYLDEIAEASRSPARIRFASAMTGTRCHWSKTRSIASSSTAMLNETAASEFVDESGEDSYYPKTRPCHQ